MKTREQLLAEAEEAERTAALVSLREDKDALLRRARELRREAERASKPRGDNPSGAG